MAADDDMELMRARLHNPDLFGGMTFEERRQIVSKSKFPDSTPCPGCGHKVFESIWWSSRIQSEKDPTVWDWWHSTCLWKKVYGNSQ
jgi:hypothetical protein